VVAQRRCCGMGELTDDVRAGTSSAVGEEMSDAEPPAVGLGRGAIVLRGPLGDAGRLDVLRVIVNIGADGGRVAGAGGVARTSEEFSREAIQLPQLDGGQVLTVRVLSGLLGSTISGGSTMICGDGDGRGGSSQARPPWRRGPDVGAYLPLLRRAGSAWTGVCVGGRTWAY
jgi:hypothetical protein